MNKLFVYTFFAVAMLLSAYDLKVGQAEKKEDKNNKKAEHCIVAAEDANENGDNVSPNSEAEVVCFDTFAQAVEIATKGNVILPYDAIPSVEAIELIDIQQTINEMKNGGVTASGDVVVGVHYKDWDYGGSSLTVTYPCSCSQGCSCQLNNLSTISGWNDKISSLVATGGCWIKSYEHAYFNGSAHFCYGSCPDMCTYGSGGWSCYMDNKTSSTTYRP